MKKSMKYVTPEIEVTKFDLDTNILISEGGSGHDGDIITEGEGESFTTIPPFTYPGGYPPQ